MKRSAKCSIAIHSLLVIALFGEETKVTSDLIARSTGSNAVPFAIFFTAFGSRGLSP